MSNASTSLVHWRHLSSLVLSAGLIIMDPHRFKAADYLANFDWISNGRHRGYNRSLIENLIRREVRIRSQRWRLNRSVGRRAIGNWRFIFDVRAHRNFKPTWRYDENVPTKFLGWLQGRNVQRMLPRIKVISFFLFSWLQDSTWILMQTTN